MVSYVQISGKLFKFILYFIAAMSDMQKQVLLRNLFNQEEPPLVRSFLVQIYIEKCLRESKAYISKISMSELISGLHCKCFPDNFTIFCDLALPKFTLNVYIRSMTSFSTLCLKRLSPGGVIQSRCS